MEIKKIYSLKHLFAFLMILPMIFLFSACDLFGSKKGQLDTEASCDTSGTYAISNATQYTEAMMNADSFANNSYRFTATLIGETTDSNNMKIITKLSVNAIINDSAIAYKKTVEQTRQEKVSMTMYYSNGVAYVNENGEKSTSTLNYTQALNTISPMSYFYRVEQILSVVDNSSNITYEKNGSKFKLTIANVNGFDLGYATVQNAPAWIYLNLTNDNKIQALKFSTSLSAPEYNYKYKINATMSAFDGEIELPNPEDFNN